MNQECPTAAENTPAEQFRAVVESAGLEVVSIPSDVTADQVVELLERVIELAEWFDANRAS